MRFTTATLLALGACVSATAATFKYPETINDTTTREEPVFLMITETSNLAYAYRNLQFYAFPGVNTSYVINIDPTSPVAPFQLVNGQLQIANGLHYSAKLVYSETTNNVQRYTVTFAKYSDPIDSFTLLSISDDGLFSLYNPDAVFNKYNGFAICKAAGANTYRLEYQSDNKGRQIKGCERIALHTTLGPPFLQ